ncbi:MAG: RloB family protein [Candidatus Symbiothrix sp.]|jgi:hypothetical protein|nr:RloB family protein [Candidatus Symbiothrix sp.]
MSYLCRNKIYEKVKPFKDAKKIYIFCEGERTEIGYFIYFKGFVSNIDIIPIPNENGKSDPKKLKVNAELFFNGNDVIKPQGTISIEQKDEIWFVIDTDRWNEGKKIENLKSYCKSKNTEYNGWAVAQSNPCFEIWQFYHFFDKKPDKTEVAIFSSFKKFMNNKVQGGFDNRKMPIEIQQAIINSETNFEVENEQPKLYSTEVFRLAKVIFSFTKEQINKCAVAGT